MPDKTADRRVLKTRRAIRNALATLLSEKDLNDITVKDLADAADINRKTFYNNYAGIHEVLDSIENEIVNAFSAVLHELSVADAVFNPFLLFERLTDVINMDMDFYGALFVSDRGFSLIDKTIRMLMNTITHRLVSNFDISEPAAGTTLCYTVSGMLAVYRMWFKSDRATSIEEISQTLGTLCTKGLSGVLILKKEDK